MVEAGKGRANIIRQRRTINNPHHLLTLRRAMKGNLKFLQVDAGIFAQQMTLVAATLYAKITASECEAWPVLSKHSNMPEQTPNINSVIRHHEEIYHWALGILVMPIDQDTQLQAMSHLIAIAGACRSLNNFSTLFSIIVALTDEQAQQASQSIDASARSKLMQLHALMGPAKGFIEYRRAVRLATLPCIPCLG